MVFSDYDLIIINTSAGKDSLCSIWEVCRLADEQKYDKNKIVLSHQDLGTMEWEGVRQLAKKQADFFGLRIYYSSRRTKDGVEETLLDYVKRRRKWPSRDQRYCTSDFKRGPGQRVVTSLTKGMKKTNVLYVFGFRKQESPARSKKVELFTNKNLTNKNRAVFDYLPILEWDTLRVWHTIKKHNLPYHPAYGLGMPRLSCCFCIFSPFDALVIAGILNPELLQSYVDTEKEIGHKFRNDFSIESVQIAIQNGYTPKKVSDWVM